MQMCACRFTFCTEACTASLGALENLGLFCCHLVKCLTACCIWSFISSISHLNQWSSSLGLYCHVLLKRDLWDWDWRLRLNDTPNAIVCVSYGLWDSGSPWFYKFVPSGGFPDFYLAIFGGIVSCWDSTFMCKICMGYRFWDSNYDFETRTTRYAHNIYTNMCIESDCDA